MGKTYTIKCANETFSEYRGGGALRIKFENGEAHTDSKAVAEYYHGLTGYECVEMTGPPTPKKGAKEKTGKSDKDKKPASEKVKVKFKKEFKLFGKTFAPGDLHEARPETAAKWVEKGIAEIVK